MRCFLRRILCVLFSLWSVCGPVLEICEFFRSGSLSSVSEQAGLVDSVWFALVIGDANCRDSGDFGASLFVFTSVLSGS